MRHPLASAPEDFAPAADGAGLVARSGLHDLGAVGAAPARVVDCLLHHHRPLVGLAHAERPICPRSPNGNTEDAGLGWPLGPHLSLWTCPTRAAEVAELPWRQQQQEFEPSPNAGPRRLLHRRAPPRRPWPPGERGGRQASSNVLLTPSLRAKVGDFRFARLGVGKSDAIVHGVEAASTAAGGGSLRSRTAEAPPRPRRERGEAA